MVTGGVQVRGGGSGVLEQKMEHCALKTEVGAINEGIQEATRS